MHHHISLTCPECETRDGAVGRISDGSWYCFHCRNHGKFSINMTTLSAVSTTSNVVPTPSDE